jgi:hypothetical protein
MKTASPHETSTKTGYLQRTKHEIRKNTGITPFKRIANQIISNSFRKLSKITPINIYFLKTKH